MSFLTPLFLLGGLAVAGPILFHLIRRTTNQRMPFSTLMFLQPTPPRLTRKSRIEHWVLLLLRCLVLGLLALGFARPFLSGPTAPAATGGGGRRIVLLVDVSASMQRGNLWAQARDKVHDVLDRARPDDEIALLAYDRQARPWLTLEQWRQAPVGQRPALARERLEALKPGWQSAHLGHALAAAVEQLEEPGREGGRPAVGPAGQIHVISDLAEGTRLDGLQGMQWPAGVQVAFDPVTLRRHSNAGVQLVAETEENVPAAEETVRVRVANAPDARTEQFQLEWQIPGAAAPPGTVNVQVPAGQSRVVRVPRPAGAERLQLQGDDASFDNLVHMARPRAEQARILYLGNETPGDVRQPLYYLQRAFQNTRSLDVNIEVRPAGQALSAAELAAASLIVVTEPPPAERVGELRAALRAGRSMLYCLPNAGAAAGLAALLGVAALPAEEAEGGRYALIGQVDFTHPVFQPFADPRYSDFTRIHFWKHRRLALEGLTNAVVLARFDDQSPLLARVPVDQGQVFVLTSGWQPTDSQLALSSKFVPLLYSLLEQTGAMFARRAQYAVGDELPLPRGLGDQAVLVKPDGAERPLAGRSVFTETDQPGIYVLRDGPAAQRLAINLSPEESRTAPLAVEELERLGVPVQTPALDSTPAGQARQQRLQNAELEGRQKLWRWLLVAALIVLLLETWLAAFLTRRPVPAESAP